jgi:hypothetical protein
MMPDFSGWLASYDAMIEAADKIIEEGRDDEQH